MENFKVIRSKTIFERIITKTPFKKYYYDYLNNLLF